MSTYNLLNARFRLFYQSHRCRRISRITKRFYSVQQRIYINNVGKGIKHEYERHGEVVFDKTTGLTWQQSGSLPQATYASAEEYVRKLNYQKFAGYIDWRLPALEEAMSLMEPDEKTGDLYIDPVFDRRQRWIWTADKQSAGWAWYAYFVYFDYGVCNSDNVDGDYFVRVVRSGQ